MSQRTILLLVLAFFVGSTAYLWFKDASYIRCLESYSFVNPQTACASGGPVISKAGYADLRKRIETYIEEQTQSGVLTDAAVYFRDLKQGPVMGINERADYAPASLLKLPLAIMYLNAEEANPGFFNEQPALRYSIPTEGEVASSSLNISQVFPPPEEIIPGEVYTVEELLKRLLAYSDNRASELLTQHALATLGGESAFVATYRDLGMIDSASFGDEIVTVRSYAGIFRLLYHANYLPADLSELALSWLSESSFTEGLVAGIPKGVRIAHKFGERELVETQTQQLHDCGVIYYPDNPYLLCVMTKGKDVRELTKVIAEISRMTYEEVDSRRL